MRARPCVHPVAERVFQVELRGDCGRWVGAYEWEHKGHTMIPPADLAGDLLVSGAGGPYGVGGGRVPWGVVMSPKRLCRSLEHGRGWP